jgi:tRNA dimethylallyltransferase
VLAECAARGRTALVTGGSGFYLKALTGGVSLAPPGRPETVAALRARLTTEGPGALRRELEERDPASAAAIMPADTYRLLRALAVLADTGKPRSVFVAAPVAATPAVFLALAVPRPMLYARIEARCAGMIRTGALDEARALRARGLPADDPLWRAIGMPHLCGVLDGTLTVGEAQSRMAQDTRHYAKRQMTWLRGQPGVRWIDAVDERAAVAAVIEAARTAEK